MLEIDQRIIQGIKCDKATLDFRGRKWTAWYDPSNPLPFGPWKFHGLPGAIIEIYDESGDVCISLIEIREGSKYILKPNKVYDELKRTGYLKAVKYLLKDGGGSKTIAPPANSLGQHIKPRTHKLFYVAMELE